MFLNSIYPVWILYSLTAVSLYKCPYCHFSRWLISADILVTVDLLTQALTVWVSSSDEHPSQAQSTQRIQIYHVKLKVPFNSFLLLSLYSGHFWEIEWP